MSFHPSSLHYYQNDSRTRQLTCSPYATPPAPPYSPNPGGYFVESAGSRSPARAHQLPIMPLKRSGDEADGTPAKLVKREDPEDFSNAVKKRLQSSSRTGQACDRCKVRKIRCDALPGGCSPCLQSTTECRTTDRTTGTTRVRGHIEQLEEQNRSLQLRIRDLEQRLLQVGEDIRPSNGYHDASLVNYDLQQSNAHTTTWNPNPTKYDPASEETKDSRALPTFRSGCNGDNYLGVSAGNANLSSIKGTALSILGMEIDIADFRSDDMDEPDPSLLHGPLYNKSYQAFLQTAMNVNPRLDKVELPSRQEGFIYAQWYFRVLWPYSPLLHKPTFFKLLTRMYDDDTFRPTASQIVIMHMVFAIMFFQYATRNWEDADQQRSLNDRSNTHYHYALSFFYQLSVSRQVEDIQAMTMICSHLRNFPKPGASWMMTQTTMSLALELGLHRSVKRWSSDIRPNALDVEMRKRIFWCLISLHVAISGRLGRPMLLRYDDYDVEMAEPIDDDLLSENGLDTSRPGKCKHNIGLVAFRIIPLYMEMYNTIYTVRRDPDGYLSKINRLEVKIQAWKASIPAELVRGDAGESEQEGRVFALYAQVWALEFRLLLRHPSVSATTDAKFNAESMRICVESSRQMLGAVRQMQRFKSLDTTWYQVAVYVLAITTTLFAQWDKRNEASAADLAALREEMDIWLEIMGDIGAFLGSGTQLREAVRVVTDGTLALLTRGLTSTTSLYDIKPPPSSAPTFTSPHQTYSEKPVTVAYVPDSVQSHQQASYPSAYNAYSDAVQPQNQAYNPSATYPTYTPTVHIEPKEKIDTPLAAFATQASQLPSSNHSVNPYHQGLQNTVSSSWQQYTNTMAGNLEMQDCYSASALMQLQGGRDMVDVVQQANAAVNSGLDEGAGQVSTGMEGQWPLIVFDVGQIGSGQ